MCLMCIEIAKNNMTKEDIVNNWAEYILTSEETDDSHYNELKAIIESNFSSEEILEIANQTTIRVFELLEKNNKD